MINVKPFIELGQQKLAPYLSGISQFVEHPEKHPKYGSPALRRKPPEIYLRNMLAVGVLSKLNRRAFLETKSCIIVLPDCLKNYGGWTCSKDDPGNAPECMQCNPDCLVFKSMERFADNRTGIFLEPENLKKFFEDIIRQNGTVGVVGVACMLTLLSGFKTTLSLKLPTQGVFLNYASCGHHWADPPYNTSYSFRRMARILDKNNNRSCQPDRFSGRGETYSLERSPNSPDDFYRRLDELATVFEKDYLPCFYNNQPDADLYAISLKVLNAIVPDLITRDSA